MTPVPALNILYVEDNALVREVTSELLAQDDRRICACDSAEEALKQFSEAPFDVVITDANTNSLRARVAGIDGAPAPTQAPQ